MARVNVTRGYTSGAIGAIVSLHAKHYAGGPELGLAFEAKIAMGLSAFLLDMDPLCDLFLLGNVQGTIAGSLVVDAHSPADGEAQFRWFIVHPWYNPDEVCSSLVAEALQFCSEKNYRRIVLLTRADSDIARRMTGDWGFRLVGETENRDWRSPLRQQRLELVA